MKLLGLPTAVANRLLQHDDRVLITGASGWLGRAALESLSVVFGTSLEARVRCFGSEARLLKLRTGQLVMQQPLAQMSALPSRPSILLHFACLTKEKAALMSLGDYRAANRAITAATSEAAGQVGVDRVFLASSGAVYQAAALDAPEAARVYGALKLEDEAAFARYAAAASRSKVLVARLFNLSGPYINKLGSYALSSFIEQARRAGSIRIEADHPVVRSYVSVENLMALAFSELLDTNGEPHLRIDTAGTEEVEIATLASLVRSVVAPATRIERAAMHETPVDRYVGDGAIYARLMARHGIAMHGLAQQVADTAAYLAAP